MTTALEEGERSASRPGRSLPPGKTRYPLYRRLGGLQGRSGQVRKISHPLGFHPRTVQPVASRYTDYATRPTHSQYKTHIKHMLTKQNIKQRNEDITQKQMKWCLSMHIPFHHDTVHPFSHRTAESGKVRCLHNKTLTHRTTKTNDQYCWMEWKHRSAAVKVHRIMTFFFNNIFPLKSRRPYEPH
jgi:hypothetical protein